VVVVDVVAEDVDGGVGGAFVVVDLDLAGGGEADVDLVGDRWCAVEEVEVAGERAWWRRRGRR
jgi:hypothetical protein